MQEKSPAKAIFRFVEFIEVTFSRFYCASMKSKAAAKQ
jgi:hypothetical protein